MAKINLFSYFILFLIFLPILFLFFNAFFYNSRIVSLVSLYNYISFYFDKRVAIIFIRTLLISLLTAFLTCVIGLFLSILLEFTDLKLKNLFRFILFIPIIIPSYLFVFSWMGFLGKRGSFLPFVFPNIPIDIYNPIALVVFLSFSLYPISLLIISLGMKSLNRNFIDSARLIGRRNLLRKIIIPLIRPHLFFSFLIVFILSFSEYVVPSFLRVNTYSNEIFSQLAVHYNIEGSIIFSLPIILGDFILILIILYLTKRPVTTLSSYFRRIKPFIFLESTKNLFIYSSVILFILLSIFVPVLMILVESQLNFLNVLILAKEPIINSVIISIISAFTISVLGLLVYYSFRNNKFLIPIIIFPLAITSPTIGISLINLYNSTPIYNTVLMLILGYIIRYLPFSIFIFMVFFSQSSKNMIEAAKLSKKSDLKIIREILLPLTKSAFLSSFIFITIFCLSEVGLTQMLTPVGFETLALRIETLMHYGNYSYSMSLSFLMFSLVFFFYFIYIKFYGKMYENDNN